MNLYMDEYKELNTIFMRFMLEAKLTLRLNSLDKDLKNYIPLSDSSLSAVVLTNYDNIDRIKSGTFLPLCNYGHRASLPIVQQS